MNFPCRAIPCAAILLAVAAWSASCSLAAETRTFPYQAVVHAEKVEVRAGPGQRYYVTGALHQNQTVMVHRHDPGGWYMIAPPPGSFSWIDASLVRPTNGDRGVVEIPPGSSTRALVRIGSEFTDEHSYYGRELASGDEVQILGEKTLHNDQGALRMLKIAPPALEYRWAKGDYLVANGETPVSPPVDVTRVAPAEGPAPLPLPARTSNAPAPALPGPAMPAATASATTRVGAPSAAVSVKDQLSELDARYLDLTQQPPEEWDLAGLRSAYEALRPQADELLVQQIDQRIVALQKREVIQTRFLEFAELTASTTERDQALQSMQGSGVVQAGAFTTAEPEAPPAAAAGGETPPPQSFQPPGAVSPIVPDLDGAGIVQAAANSGGYVLADLSGRPLATLRPAKGVDLAPWVGRSVGVIGARRFEPSLQIDTIEVRQLLPVHLAPQ